MEQTENTDLFSSVLNAGHTVAAYTVPEMMLNVVLGFILGVIIAIVYQKTHKGMSYSQSFTLTLVFVSTIVAIIMMVIGGSLARAFALVGAMSIIRFRTVVKDTKDTAYVFTCLAVGMAAGTSNYFLAGFATFFVSVMAFTLNWMDFGATTKSEFILRFVFEQSKETQAYLDLIRRDTRSNNLIHIEPSGDGSHLTLTYDIILKKAVRNEDFVRDVNAVPGVSEIALIASKHDVDY